jgi:hypothetical protein
MSDYQAGYDEGRAAHQSAQATRQLMNGMGSLIGIVVMLGSRLLVEVAVAAPFLLVGFAAASPFDFLGGPLSLGRLLIVALTGYLGFSAIYWLKGVVIALGQRQGWLWVLPFAVCVLVTCLLPALLVQGFIRHAFPTAAPLWSWGLAAALALFAYGRYSFLRDSAPGIALWSYRRGYRWGL